MGKRAEELEAEVAGWMDAAAAADASEDVAFGRDRSGEEMPDWVGDKKRRAAKIRAAKAEPVRTPNSVAQPRPQGIPATSLWAQNRFSYCLTSPNDCPSQAP
jgi:hypothetical protein